MSSCLASAGHEYVLFNCDDVKRCRSSSSKAQEPNYSPATSSRSSRAGLTTPRKRILPLTATTGTSVLYLATRSGSCRYRLARSRTRTLGFFEHLHGLLATTALGARINREGQVLGARGFSSFNAY